MLVTLPKQDVLGITFPLSATAGDKSAGSANFAEDNDVGKSTKTQLLRYGCATVHGLLLAGSFGASF